MLEVQDRLNSTVGVVQLSEQQLIDCKHDNNVPSGGIMSQGPQSHQLAYKRADYPYKSFSCRDSYRCHFDKTKALVTTRRLKEPLVLELKDEGELKKVLAKHGPISIGIHGSPPNFDNHKAGVY